MRASLLHTMNELVLVLISAWAHEEDAIGRAFETKNGEPLSLSRLRKLHRRANRIDALVTLAILASRGLRDKTRCESMSLRKLAMTLEDDAGAQKAAENTLRKIILPSLADLGWINDFKPQQNGERGAHDISVTEQGLEAHSRFLLRCHEDLGPLFDELRAAGGAGKPAKPSRTVNRSSGDPHRKPPGRKPRKPKENRDGQRP